MNQSAAPKMITCPATKCCSRPSLSLNPPRSLSVSKTSPAYRPRRQGGKEAERVHFDSSGDLSLSVIERSLIAQLLRDKRRVNQQVLQHPPHTPLICCSPLFFFLTSSCFFVHTVCWFGARSREYESTGARLRHCGSSTLQHLNFGTHRERLNQFQWRLSILAESFTSSRIQRDRGCIPKGLL